MGWVQNKQDDERERDHWPAAGKNKVFRTKAGLMVCCSVADDGKTMMRIPFHAHFVRSLGGNGLKWAQRTLSSGGKNNTKT